MEIEAPRAEEFKKRILLVEDEGLIAADIQGRLERLGYSVPAVVDSGEEALRCARAASFDLVLMDIRLNGEMDGIEAAQVLKTDYRTPVVYITAHADSKTIQRAKLTEPFGYVLKPIVDGDLLSAVEIATYKHSMERKQLETRVTQVERMETMTNRAAGLAREFNDKLSNILGNAEELCDRLPDAYRQKALEIRRSASAASSITRQLLTLSGGDGAEFQLLHADEEIGALVPALRQGLGKTWEVATDLGSAAELVCYDRDQFRHVVLDLAFHARDAMPGGGTLRIDTRLVELGAGQSARQHSPGRYVRLRVAASGENAGWETSSTFAPFDATSEARSGTLRSLSNVHSIVRQSGGYLAAAGGEGHGASFEVLSPCVSMVQTAPEGGGIYELMRMLEAERKVTQQALHNLLYRTTGQEPAPTVLLVDPEDTGRRLMHEYLEGEGYKVLEARNGEDGQRIAAWHEESIQILITNVTLPDLTGPRLAERLQAHRPEIKVLFVSGSGRSVLDSKLVPGGSAIVLQKPFRVSELLQCVERLLNLGKLATN